MMKAYVKIDKLTKEQVSMLQVLDILKTDEYVKNRYYMIDPDIPRLACLLNTNIVINYSHNTREYKIDFS